MTIAICGVAVGDVYGNRGCSGWWDMRCLIRRIPDSKPLSDIFSHGLAISGNFGASKRGLKGGRLGKVRSK